MLRSLFLRRHGCNGGCVRGDTYRDEILLREVTEKSRPLLYQIYDDNLYLLLTVIWYVWEDVVLTLFFFSFLPSTFFIREYSKKKTHSIHEVETFLVLRKCTEPMSFCVNMHACWSGWCTYIIWLIQLHVKLSYFLKFFEI